MVGVGLCVRLIAAPGKKNEVAAFLEKALPLVEAEPETTAWFAARVEASSFLIFDVFPTEAGRQQHLAGPVAEALAAHAADLLSEPPTIEPVELPCLEAPGIAADTGTGLITTGFRDSIARPRKSRRLVVRRTRTASPAHPRAYARKGPVGRVIALAVLPLELGVSHIPAAFHGRVLRRRNPCARPEVVPEERALLPLLRRRWLQDL
jgi:quinol monooxygenase YgiN